MSKPSRLRPVLLLVAFLLVGSVAGVAPPPRLTSASRDDPKDAPKNTAKIGNTSPMNPNGALPDSWVTSFNWRCIGPANMGGRITALAVCNSDPTMYWIATASGGLLKTTNNGVTFEHQFDKEATVSIGDVAVAPSNKDIVWVGTGESNPRNSVSYGDGVYKSTDGGKTWKNMGLKKTFQIGRIAIHPNNPDIVYVGALGRLYGPSEDRGLFKTLDGGKTWVRQFFVNDKTGIIDLAMHPGDPETLLIATWEVQRDGFDSWPGTEVKKPEALDGYDPLHKWGKGGGIWKTTDGGSNFKRLETGLPSSKIGRVGLDYSRKDPSIVYAIVDCEDIGKGPPPAPVYLGAVAEDVGKQTRLSQVLPGSPADKAGLKVGDVIEEAGGKPVATFDALLEQLKNRKAGEDLAVKLKRGEDSKTLQVRLTTRPAAGGGRGAGGPGGGGGPGGAGGAGGAGGPGGRFGPGGVSPVYLGVTGEDGPTGAVLRQITEDGPAEKAGLQVDDEVQAIDGKKIADYAALLTALRTHKPGEKVKLTVLRDRETKEITVTLAERPGFGGGGGGPTRTRPYLATLAGQNPNLQDQQGSKGFLNGGVYRSADGGETWQRVNSLNPRPMYFSQIRVDPSDASKVYVLGVSQYRSNDGGVTFTQDFGRGVHADAHALWIDPRDGRHMLIGCDGGTYVSYDRGTTWDHLNHVAIAQFYHVAVSPRKPYYVYGGLQDNGSWGAPSSKAGFTGPINEDWISVGGGDGFTCRVDQTDPDVVYSTSQGGAMSRRNLRTGETGRIRPARQQGQGGPTYRFNWNTPFFLSSHNQRVFYAGSQFVHRSLNRGDDLKTISPELTLTKRGSMSALAESPRNPDVLWAGTDDGGLWVTRDGGKKWTNLTNKMGMPKPYWVSTIEASRFKEGRAYVCFDAHRSDDDRPYVYVTEDFGQTWKTLTPGLPEFGSTRCLREDLVNENLLYCGTEFAFFVSLDRGSAWAKLNSNLPTVAIHEVALHPTAGEIVVATHGRSVWALDVTALRQIKPGDLRADVAQLYRPATAERQLPEPTRGRASRRFVGTNPSSGTLISYALPRDAEKLSLKIMDIEGKVVREFRAPTEAGLHHLNWDLTQGTAGGGRRGAGGAGGAGAERQPRQPGRQPNQPGRQPTQPGGGGPGGFGGPTGRGVPAGTYRVVLNVDGQEKTQTVRVIGEAPQQTFLVPGVDDD